MKRTTFSQILKNANIDIQREYSRLFHMFYDKHGDEYSVERICEFNFERFPFRDTCTDLADFNEVYGFNYVEQPADFDENYLVNFCEYSYNLSKFNCGMAGIVYGQDPVREYMNQIFKVIEKIGYMENDVDGITEFVPKDQAAIAVAEIVEQSLSYRLIEYNHHSMKGDLDKKKKIIRDLADKLEPERKRLGNYNKELSDNLFYLVNKLNIRHNNIAEGTPNYYPTVANMDDDELETWYDEIYQMLLLAFLELEHIERKEKIKGLKERIENKK